MNSIRALFCMAAVLMTALCVQAKTITYDFDDGTAQGWVNDAKAGREFLAWDTTADDNGGQFIAYSGDFAMRIDEYGARDDNTDLLLITSPEFKISGGTTIEVWALGGMGPVAEPTWSNYADVPTTATSSGFMGIALRRVSDGEYVLFGRRDRSSESDDATTWTPIEWDAATIAAAVASDNPSERYVVDVIDSYTGGWGWFGFDEVTMTNIALISDTLAADPIPADGAQDVDPATALTWQAGQFAEMHDVYFGTDFDEVNNATVGSDVYMGRQSDAVYVPGDLELGMTYYWRIDEVNGAPDFTIFKGETWGFTVEPFAYPIQNIVATSNGASGAGNGPERTVDGSGLNAADEHSTVSQDMWLATAGAEPLQIQYEFDQVYKLQEMLVWNYNVQFEILLGFGLKDVTVEYSENGTDWTVLGDVQFAQATAGETYTANTTVTFDGVPARYVRLTVNSGYGMTGQFGLSEVRFMYIPVQAREPEPADGAADVAVGTDLVWRAGRGAVSHEVYFGTDAAALALVETTSSTSYTPAPLDLATTYYWQVVEVNEADAVTAWPGGVWSFTIQEFIAVDDFEAYNDDIDAGTTIFDAWIDGWTNGTGSTVGYFDAPFAEKTIVHNGRQSMPLFFDNTSAATSEAVRELTQDWSSHGIEGLSLYFYGAEGNSGQLYVKINDIKIPYDGPAVNIVRPSWQRWSIDLSQIGDVSSVRSLTIGVEGAGTTGVVYIDDVRLYPEVLDDTSPDVTGAGDTVQGIPNDGDWPDAEYPALAVDDNVNTKYLHRKGGSMATGFQVAPLLGSTVVTGLTFTTANDTPTRDPISFRLSGSNTSIDGPYTLIAEGDIVDFAGATEWPRFTKTTTPIEFENTTAYTYYEIVFPTLRGATETLMQIAEVEFIGQ